MSLSLDLPRLAVRVLLPVGLGLLLAAGTGFSMASADDTPYGDDTVTITVTISELDLCERHLPGCDPGGDGELSMTGAQVATPLGLSVLLLAAGAGVFAFARRERPTSH